MPLIDDYTAEGRIECRKTARRCVIEWGALVIIGSILGALVMTALHSALLLKILFLIPLSCAVVFGSVSLLQNRAMIVLDERGIAFRCRKIDANKFIWKTIWLNVTLDQIDYIWVGRANEYKTGVLLQKFESRGYPNENTLVIQLKDTHEAFQMREFSWLSNTNRLLDALNTWKVTIKRGN